MKDPRKFLKPSTVNEILQDRAIRHAVYLVRVAGGEAKWFRDQLPGFRRRITEELAPFIARMDISGVVNNQLLFEEASQKAARVSQEFFEDIYQKQKERAVEIAVAESGFEARVLDDTLPIRTNFKHPSNILIEAMITSNPLDGKTMNEWFKDIPQTVQTQVNREITEGVLNGESQNKIMRRVRGTREAGFKDGIIGRAGRTAENLVRTGAMKASNVGREAFFQENSEVIKNYSWVLTLDSRTCTICVQGASDNPYPVGSPPQVPAHILCRCIFVAITKSWEELGIDLDEMEPGTRTAVVNGMRGEVPDTVTYQDWFEMQNTEFQADILGPSRFNAYEKGSKITDFVDNGKILSIEELKLRGLDFS